MDTKVELFTRPTHGQLSDCRSVFHALRTLIFWNRIALCMHKSIFLLFLLFILCLLLNVCSFHPYSSPPPTLRKSLDFYNETIVNPRNYILEISFSNIHQICVLSFRIIILLWLTYLYTIFNHVRYVCFTTNLSLLSKEKTLTPSQFLSILLSLLILGLLYEIEGDQIPLFIIGMNPNLGILLQLFFYLRKIISRITFTTLSIHIFSIAITPVACTVSLIVFQIWSCSLRKKYSLGYPSYSF